MCDEKGLVPSCFLSYVFWVICSCTTRKGDNVKLLLVILTSRFFFIWKRLFFWSLMASKRRVKEREQLNDIFRKLKKYTTSACLWVTSDASVVSCCFVALFFLPKEMLQYDIKQILYKCLVEFLRPNIQNKCPLCFFQIIHFCYDNITFLVRRNYLQSVRKALLSNWELKSWKLTFTSLLLKFL